MTEVRPLQSHSRSTAAAGDDKSAFQEARERAAAVAATKLNPAEEWAYGVMGGIGKVVTGHPFDTIKGRVQSGAFKSSRVALRKTLAREGPSALWQGVLPPCISVGFVSGLLFFANARIRTFLQPDPNVRLSYEQMALAGGGAGAITSLVLTPLDQIKIWQQVERRVTEQAKRKPSAAIPAPAATAAAAGTATAAAPEAAAAAAVTAAAAGPKSLSQNSLASVIRVSNIIGHEQLYRGFTATLLREIGTFGIFFPCNEFVKDVLIKARTGDPWARTKPVDLDAPPPKPLPLHLRVLAAGFSGVVCWLPCYPIDVIKTRQQLQGHPMLTDKRVPAWQGVSMRRAAHDIFREQGPRGFTLGLGPCLLRAFPTYTVQFTLFDYLTSAARERTYRNKSKKEGQQQ